MPSGPRIRANNVYGLTTDNPLTAGAVTFNSPGLALLPVVSSAHAVVTLDPLREFGEPEIVVVTAHTAAATVATIVRGQYGTAARSHPENTTWVHAPLDEDFIENVALTTEIVDPYRGQMLFDRTLNRYVGRETSDVWSNINMLADPPACRVFDTDVQALTNNTLTALVFNNERYDTAVLHDTATNPTRITFPTTGIYEVGGCVETASRSDFLEGLIGVRVDGITYLGFNREVPTATNFALLLSVSTSYKFTAGQYVELIVRQQNSAAAAVNTLVTGNYSPEFWATWIGRG